MFVCVLWLRVYDCLTGERSVAHLRKVFVIHSGERWEDLSDHKQDGNVAVGGVVNLAR